jgi:membrane dipeptidase
MNKRVLLTVSCAALIALVLLVGFKSLNQQLVYAQEAAEKFWVFDGHMHPISSVYRRGGTNGEPNADPRFTLALAEQGGLGAAYFNTSIDEFYEANHLAVKDALKQIDRFYREVARYPDQVGVATNAQQVRALRREGKIAAILAIEGALAIESDLGVLRMFHRLGLREMNLVHLRANHIGDVGYSNTNLGRGYGLTRFGHELVAEMNRLGILIDLSHTAEQTVVDVIEASTQPVSTTHSGARAVSGAGWRDEVIQKLAAKGGVICVPFLPMTVSREFREKQPRGGTPRASRLVGWGPLIFRGDPATIYEFIDERNQRSEAGRGERAGQVRQDLPPLSDLIDHIDHIVRLVGVNHVGISSDFGGYPNNIKGAQNAGEYQNIAQALLQRGYSGEDVAKIMGENMLRLFDEVESTAGINSAGN